MKHGFWKKAFFLAVSLVAFVSVVGTANTIQAATAKRVKVRKHSRKKPKKTAKRRGRLIASPKSSLVVYFTVSGNTGRAARQIARDTKAKTFRIRPVRPYSTDYDQTVDRAARELGLNRAQTAIVNPQIHPAIANRIPNWKKYKTIYLGFPTWWQQPPMIIHTFFNQYSFRGKTIVPFTTSMETPMSASMPYVRRMAKQKHAKRVVKGFRYDDNKAALRAYLRRNKLIK